MNNYHKIVVSSVVSVFGILFLGYSFSLLTDKFGGDLQGNGEKSVAQVSKTAPVSQARQQGNVRVTGSPYQDIIVNNKIVKRGRGPSCESRYEKIAHILSQYKRPITVLDIGAAEGYMSFRIAHDFDASCVMIEHPSGESGGFLKKLCELNTDRDNIILLYKKITAEELQVLSQSEHFDVVLAFNVLHHFPQDKWKIAADAILNMADYAIVETPPVEDTGSIGRSTLAGIIEYLEQKNGKVVAQTSRRHTRPDTFANMYLVKGCNVGLGRRGLLDMQSPGYKIDTSLEDRFLLSKSDGKKVDFPKGINLMTFKLFNGVYPTKQMVKTSLAKLKQKGHSVIPQDVVIQGEKLVSIGEAKDGSFSDDQMLEYACNIIDTSDMKQVVQLCKQVYTKVHEKTDTVTS